MKGYKGTNTIMQCRGTQYEMGKTFLHHGPLELCAGGFHFCRNLSDVFQFYDPQYNNRFFEVEATGNIVTGDKKAVASEIRFIRELSRVEINRARYGYGYGDGDGYGYGNGYGNGYGYGYGNGYGNGYGDGDGYGNGNGYGYGNGYGDGDGYGNGNGYGYGYGNGYGNGYGDIQKLLLFR